MSKYSPDVILLNETNTVNFNIKILGYQTIEKCFEQYNGVAILVKKPFIFHEIPTADNSSIAIKIYTALGPVIIYTQYSPPRHQSINTIPMNKILNLNLPTIIIGDFNAKNNMFQNGRGDQTARFKGEQLVNIINNRNLSYAGPDFNTYKTNTGEGKPDLILLSKEIIPFHYKISQGDFMGSDHLPIIFKISIHPIKTAVKRKNLHSLNIENFKNDLKNDSFPDFQNKNVTILDDTLSSIVSNIQKATANNSKEYIIIPAQSYVPNYKTKQKIKQVTSAYNSYLNTGSPNIGIINKYKNELNLIVLNETKHSWNKIVEIASNNFGKPAAFWKDIHKFQYKKPAKISHLEYHTNPLTSDTSSYASTETDEYITEKEKAQLMSVSWRKIFQPHNSAEFQTENTKKVEDWFKQNKHRFRYKYNIDLTSLPENHPLLRPIKSEEYMSALKHSKKGKAPGPSGIKLDIIQHLPKNYNKTIISIYNSITCTQYWPFLFKTSNMIFLHKPGKDPTNPYNYRPITLIETLAKLYEKIITQRLLHYLEHHNFLPEFQFGFRTNRSTNHSIYMILETLKEYRNKHQTALIATRDITKAFDTVWFEGLIYKLSEKFNFDDLFVSLIFNYIINRQITPYFSQTKGPAFTPKAGVPQGSCLGPIVFILYVSDMPETVHPNTQKFQYADDLNHIVNSDTKGRNKNKIAIRKMENELEITLSWERDWKIKTSLEKCSISYTGTKTYCLENLGGVIVDNTKIPFNSPVKILGYALTPLLNEKTQIDNIIFRARNNLSKLYRFKSAPNHVKRYLYIALIRPLLEYPSSTLYQANKTNISKLQKIQNKALRFINSTKLSDQISSISLHKRYKLDPINVRLFNLGHKVLYKMRDLYLPSETTPKLKPFNKLDIEYEITEEPIHESKESQLNTIIKTVFKDTNRKTAVEKIPNKSEDLIIPAPIYL